MYHYFILLLLNIVWVCHILFILSIVNGHLPIFWLLWLILWTILYKFSENTLALLLSRILGHITTVSIVFEVLPMWLHHSSSPKAMYAGCNLSTSSPTLVTVFILAIPAGVKWYLIDTLICIYLVADAVEHLFLYVLATCLSLLEKCLFTSDIFTTGYFSFYHCVCVFIYSG